MPETLDNYLSLVKRSPLDNPRVAEIRGRAYNPRMASADFRETVLREMESQDLNKAELSRRSGVSYHALDKFLKGATASMSADRTKALADALGISLAGDDQYEELRRLYYRLSPEQRGFFLEQLRALADRAQ